MSGTGRDEAGMAGGTHGVEAERTGRRERDEVDLASEDSFPASDPPSFTPVNHPGSPVAGGRLGKPGR